MKTFFKTNTLLSILVCMILCGGIGIADAATPAKKKQTSQVKSSKKKAAAKKAPRQTSSAVKKQEQNVNQEIRLTQQQIEENEAEVKKNISILQGLEHDIALQKQKVSDLQSQEKQINTDISACQNQIKAGEAGLQALRQRYISAIKKMRVARKRTNPLAYIFASKSFYQAWRRLRYMQKFNKWRATREVEIKNKLADLAELNKQLDAGHKQLKSNLSQQQQAQQVLAAKHSAQDEAIQSLRSHGDALRKHLAAKQAEANALSAKVMELIAAEQEEARIAELKRKEAEAKAAAEKAAREKAAAEKAAKEKAAKEKAEAEKAAKEKEAKQQEAKKKESQKKETKKPQPQKQESKKQESKKQENKTQEPAKESSGKTYAEARNRKPRSNTSENKQESKPTTSATTSQASGFASAKGSLPHPASGQFTIVSHFGRHPLPDLPDVIFDNPGIDAVVASGASAQAVYDGTVTRVYVVPGFGTVIILKHGEYYTVYGNIGKPSVKQGDSVKQGENLGKLLSDSDEGGRTTIHFEIYKNREKLNPEIWLR